MSSLGKQQETEGNSSCVKSDIITFSKAQVSCSLVDREKTSFASEEADRLQEAVGGMGPLAWHGRKTCKTKLTRSKDKLEETYRIWVPHVIPQSKLVTIPS